MKNKALKNLILLGIFAFTVFGANNVFAGYYNPYLGHSTYDYSSTNGSSNDLSSQQYLYNYAQVQPYSYVQSQPQVQYVQQPTQIQYVPQQTVKYVSTASNDNNTNTRTVANTKVATSNTTRTSSDITTKNTGVVDSTGKYISYDADSQNVMGASAYNSNGELTAMTVKGSGSFMPSSVFQWFILILLILAIIIVARMVSKTFNKNSHEVPVH